jgi:DNA repair protein RecO (recombination protein O)
MSMDKGDAGIRRISIAKAAGYSINPGVHATRATLIRLTRLTDTSLIVHWFTAGHGLVKTVARGARRPGSHFAGQLDLFFAGEISFQRARRGELHPLREVSISHWREGMRKSYTSVLLAGYWCRLLESAVEPEHPDASLHDLLERALDHIDTAGPSLRAFRHFERELARLLGVAHQHRPAEACLRDLLGHLPDTRDDLIERLSGNREFPSSSDGNHA